MAKKKRFTKTEIKKALKESGADQVFSYALETKYKTIRNAIRSYAAEAKQDDAVAVLDASPGILSTGKKGCLITVYGIYAKGFRTILLSEIVSASTDENGGVKFTLDGGVECMLALGDKGSSALAAFVAAFLKNKEDKAGKKTASKKGRPKKKEAPEPEAEEVLPAEPVEPEAKEVPSSESAEPEVKETVSDESLTEEQFKELDQMAERARSLRVGGQIFKALALYEETAAQGGCNALIALAEYYRTGEYFTKDLQKAKSMFLQAEKNAYTDRQKEKIADGLQKIADDLIELDVFAGKILVKKLPSELASDQGGYIHLADGTSYDRKEFLYRCRDEIRKHNERVALYLLLKGYPKAGWKSKDYCREIRDLFLNRESALYDPAYGLAWYEEMVNQTSPRNPDEILKLASEYQAYGYSGKAGETLQRFREGDVVRLGMWEQFSNQQPLIWRVIEKNDTGVYLAGCTSIAQRYFDEKETFWPKAELRQWMNGAFFEKAFGEKEQGVICPMHFRDGEAEWTDRIRLMLGSELKAHLKQKEYGELSAWELDVQTEPGGHYNKRKKIPPFGMSEKDQAANQYKVPVPPSGQPKDPEEKKRQCELRKQMKTESLEKAGSDWWLLDDGNGYRVSRKRRADKAELCAVENPADQTFLVYPVICLDAD